jgi:hypothetical protein
MKRALCSIVVSLVLSSTSAVVSAADAKAIHTQKTKDVVITLENGSGQWKQGKNDFVLTFTSAQDKKAVDAGKVSLSASMAMPGMAPMVTGANLSPESPGRYRGTIDFPDRGTRQVTVAWDGPAGKGSTKFSVPVR